MSDVRCQRTDGARMNRPGEAISVFEDLEVFQRAYRLSLDVHRVSLTFPDDRTAGLGAIRSGAPRSRSAPISPKGSPSRRNPRRNSGGSSSMAIGSADEMRRVVALLSRSRLYRRGDVAAVAGRLPGDRQDAAWPCPARRCAVRFLTPDSCPLTSGW